MSIKVPDPWTPGQTLSVSSRPKNIPAAKTMGWRVHFAADDLGIVGHIKGREIRHRRCEAGGGIEFSLLEKLAEVLGAELNVERFVIIPGIPIPKEIFPCITLILRRQFHMSRYATGGQ